MSSSARYYVLSEPLLVTGSPWLTFAGPEARHLTTGRVSYHPSIHPSIHSPTNFHGFLEEKTKSSGQTLTNLEWANVLLLPVARPSPAAEWLLSASIIPRQGAKLQ